MKILYMYVEQGINHLNICKKTFLNLKIHVFILQITLTVIVYIFIFVHFRKHSGLNHHCARF